MIYKITLVTQKKNGVIPFNYQYSMSCWIYNLIRQVDPKFSEFIHDNGYEFENKHFKLFTFSNLYGFEYDLTRFGLKMKSKTIVFKIGFLSNEVALNIIQGLFNEHQLRLGKMYFKIENISTSKPIVKLETVKLRTKSPLVIKNYNQKYLEPNEEEYETIFENNLKRKYAIAAKKGWLPKRILNQELSIRFLSKRPKKQGVKIKYEKNQVIGYQYFFELTAPKVLIETGLLAGFGSQNAQGFGFCEIMKGR
ncbi:MAG: CRISPR-associated endoribonuclease Cas6 [Saprospiraceae bacterium]